MDYQKIGTLISNLRKEKGFTQKELADKLGITDRAVSKWERGHGCPDVSLLDDLSRILDISIIEILKGRKLDTDELVNNKDLIESMNYSKESFKNRIRKYVNIAAIFIIIFIILSQIFYMAKSFYYLNIKYPKSFDSEQILNQVEEFNKNISIIKANQGIFNDEEYNKILDYISKLEKRENLENNDFYINKTKFSYLEIIEFYRLHDIGINYTYYFYQSEFDDSIYAILSKHDISKIPNIIDYYNRFNQLRSGYELLFEQITVPYYNNKTIQYYFMDSMYMSIFYEYYNDNILLNDIIEVGGISE
ncbi:MAG: helix-turn-helix transcriptional regulator [Bacilli bacterium]|nr:helix-turn-helix transcriptional regulator [Bacilli bacterium]